MKKEKAFTLIEMLVVVIIIGIILTIAIPSVVRLAENNNKDSYNTQMKLIESATELYVLKHKGSFNNNSNISCYTITYDELKNEQNLKEDKIFCNGNINIHKESKGYRYEYDLNCEDKNGTKFRERTNTSNSCVLLNETTELGRPGISGGGTNLAGSRSYKVTPPVSSIGIKYYEYYITDDQNKKPKGSTLATGTFTELNPTIEKTGTYIFFRAVNNVGTKGEWTDQNNLYVNTAILSSLSVNNYEINPKFTSLNTSYETTVPYSSKSVVVNKVPANKNATVIVSGDTNLIVGSNIITLKVTGPDETTKTYIIEVTREKDTDNTLKSLEVTGYNISPKFSSNTTSYTVNVEESSIEIKAEANSEVAKVIGIGNKTISWGESEFTVSVTSQSASIKTYKLTVNNIKPTKPTITGGSSDWVASAPTIKLSKAGTAISNVKHYEYYKSTSNTSPTASTVATGTTAGSLTISDEGTTYIWYRTVSNNGFKSEWSNSQTVKLDTTPPSTPTSGALGSVSGSNKTGSVKTEASGSTDTGSGNITYKYLIKNDSNTPDKTDAGFTTTKTFTRSCGKSYYAWAIAVDKVGNKSGVKYLGTTRDGVDNYSAWGTCSKTCGGGTQTRTNTCQLVTTGLSQSCNPQSCCTFTNQTFSYKGSPELFTVPCNGTYKLEVWGASGGSSYRGNLGGAGGYSYGNITLTAGQQIYVVVGGAGTTAYTEYDEDGDSIGVFDTAGGYNGGGCAADGAGSGGGATHIGTFNSTLAQRGSTSGLYIVAGGGGGGHDYKSGGYQEWGTQNGGDGGGSEGLPGTGERDGGGGGTQSRGGINYIWDVDDDVDELDPYGYAGFGQGTCFTEIYEYGYSAGGGGGLYGGGGFASPVEEDGAGAGGGSSYIGGVISGSASTIAGNKSIPTHDGTSTMIGNRGHGYAKITLVSTTN